MTAEDIQDLIAYEYYFTAADGVRGHCAETHSGIVPLSPSLELFTFCVLVMKDGLSVVGQSYCAARGEICREIAKKAAILTLRDILE